MEPLRFTEGARFWLEANPTDEWSAPAFSQELGLDRDNQVISLFLAEPEEYRFWSLRIEDPANPAFYVEVSKIILANSDRLTRTPDTGFTVREEDLSTVEENAYGHRYGDLKPLRKSLAINYNVLDEADLLTLQEIYRSVGRVIPVVFALDPEERVFDRNRFLIYGNFTGPFETSHIHFRHFASKADLKEAL
jgi:hypothetical protein